MELLSRCSITWSESRKPLQNKTSLFPNKSNDVLTVSNLTATNGTLVNNNNGTYSFTSVPNFNGTVNLSYNVIDGKGGTVSTNQSFTVIPVNDAPTLTANAMLTTTSGETIGSLFAGKFSDIDAGDRLSGVAIVGNTANDLLRKWQYSTNSGTNWYDVSSVDDSAVALALSATTKIRLLSLANYDASPVLTVRALDNTYSQFTSGTTRQLLNSSINGGTTAIAASTNTITMGTTLM